MKKEYLIYKLSDEVKNSCKIDNELFSKYGVKRGLRNEDGSGVLVGLTNIGNVVGYESGDDGKPKPTEGKLYYRGYELDQLVSPLLKETINQKVNIFTDLKILYELIILDYHQFLYLIIIITLQFFGISSLRN